MSDDDRPGHEHDGHVVLLVENESVPTDRRVWGEACILRDAGYRVTVVSPMGEGRDSESEIEIDQITILRFPLRRATRGIVGYLIEYSTALWRMGRIVAGLDHPVQVIHSANPPDFLFLIGLVPKIRWRTKLIFDHHDLVPELFASRFSRARPLIGLLGLVERANFVMADAVVSTNESYRAIAVERGRKHPDQVRVVRNARDPLTFVGEPDRSLARGRRCLAVYVGVIGQQDGADCAVRIAGHYKHTLGRHDLQMAIVGDGDALAYCRALAAELDVEDMVDFPGWQDQDGVLRYLASADIGLATDPPSPLNDRSTMIKVVEYLASGLPIVSFDLAESVVSAGDAALYVSGGDELAFARQLTRLVDDPELRRTLGHNGLERSRGPLSWESSRDELVETYRYVLER